MIEVEIWATILNYAKYQVSNLGNVRSSRRKKRINLKFDTKKQGYQRVKLYKNGKGVKFYVHRLVAKHFVINLEPERLKFVDHKNRVKDDNISSNLRWTDHQTNMDNRRGNYGKN